MSIAWPWLLARHPSLPGKRFFALCALVFLGTGALALDPSRQLVQYHQQAFSPRGSAATEVTDVVQTADGYLWVGTSVGLYRFDGARFELMSSLGGQSILHLPVVCLFASPGGGLWVGYGGGAGAGYFKSDDYVALGADKGWGSLVSGAVDRDGSAWAVIDRRLARVEGATKRELGPDWGLPDEAIREVAVDKTGTIWVSTTGQQDLMFLPRGERRFRWVGQHLGQGLLAPAPDGTVFVSGPAGLSAVVPMPGRGPKVVAISTKSFGRALVDRDGGLIASTSAGLVHIGDARRLLEPGGEALLLGDALELARDGAQAASVVWAMSEDRDGNVWISSAAALERLRDSRFTPIPLAGTSFSYGVVPGENGSVWAQNWDSGLLRVDTHHDVDRLGSFGAHISCLYRDASGHIWFATTAGLWRSDAAGGFAPVPVPVRLLQPWVASMIVDSSGSPWLASASLVRGTPTLKAWTELSRIDGFKEMQSTRVMLPDTEGNVWLGIGSDIVRVEGGEAHAMASLSKEVRVGPIQSMSRRGPHLWIGGLSGVAVVRDGHALNLKAREGPPFNAIVGMIETIDGDLWIRGADDAWHVSAEEVNGALREGRAEVEAEHFDSLDGLANMGMKTKATVAQATDGILWFGTRQGLSWIDPARPKAATPVPPRRIQSVEVDGQRLALDGTLTLPAQARHLEIAYTAIELGYPERIQFRYKLEGFDREWQVAGTRRVAYYNELPPGEYRFRFSATDRDGRWHDDDGSGLLIHATPAWFQTGWFKLLCLLMVLLLGTLVYRLRLRHVAATLRGDLRRESVEHDRIANARQDERDRIARDLHDTLIQSTQGLIFIFQGLAEKVTADTSTRHRLDSALVRANEVAAEGRDMIEDLRLPVRAPVDLAGAFATIGSEAGEGRTARFRLTVTGASQPIPPGIGDAICRICREAVINAFRHADAASVEVDIVHDESGLIVLVRDDGIGIAKSTLDAFSIPGHWGIKGMRERAKRIGADLEFTSEPGKGTEVRLSLPRPGSNDSAEGRSRWRLFQRNSEPRRPGDRDAAGESPSGTAQHS
jgi:signal transduction histidine kinase/ligand-binding sensor domain-containing protein